MISFTPPCFQGYANKFTLPYYLDIETKLYLIFTCVALSEFCPLQDGLVFNGLTKSKIESLSLRQHYETRTYLLYFTSFTGGVW
jgi:hypothetical protein